MRSRIVLFLLPLVLAVAVAQSSGVAAVLEGVCLDPCDDDGSNGNCAPGCDDCACCTQSRVIHQSREPLVRPVTVERVAMPSEAAPRAVDPAEILHIPKRAPLG